jgi:hypothetical protein
VTRKRSKRAPAPARNGDRLTRRIAILSVLTCAVAVVALSVAMALYPGGTGAHPHLVGHSFWENVLCDLAQPAAFNGQPNDAARPFALLGTIAIFAAGVLINFLAPRVIEDPRAAHKGRRLGVATGAIAMWLPLFPSAHYPIVHSLIVLCAGPLALTGLVVWVGGILRSTAAPQSLRAITVSLGVATFLAFFAWAGWFLRMFIERHPDSDTAFPAPLVPPLQRLGLIALVLWILLVAHAAWRTTKPAARG